MAHAERRVRGPEQVRQHRAAWARLHRMHTLSSCLRMYIPSSCLRMQTRRGISDSQPLPSTPPSTPAQRQRRKQPQRNDGATAEGGRVSPALRAGLWWRSLLLRLLGLLLPLGLGTSSGRRFLRLLACPLLASQRGFGSLGALMARFGLGLHLLSERRQANAPGEASKDEKSGR